MANNRNSSSSSFSSNGNNIANAGGRGSTFKSNKQSTFDLFNINVKDAQKKTSQIFDFVKKKVIDNEKIITKSVNRIYSNIDKHSKKSAEIFTKSFSKAYEELDRLSALHHRKMSDRIERLMSSTKVKYDSMYKDLDNLKDTKNLDDLGVNIDTTGIANDISKKLSTMKIQCECICKGAGNSTSTDKTKSEGAEFLKKLTGKNSMTPAEGGSGEDKALQDIAGNISEGNEASATKGSAFIEISGMILDTLESLIKKLLAIFTDAAKAFSDQYESSYNQLATAFAADRGDIHDILKNGMNTLDNDMKGVVNYTHDFLPALEQVSKQGLMGDDALAKAIRDSVDKKIMPWLETTSEEYVNMNTYLKEGNLNALKGQQLMMQNSQNGNRLLQSGVINQLTSEIEPLLRDVEFNTGEKTVTGYEKIMESMVANGATTREAYDFAQNLAKVQKNEFAAYQSGDASQIIAAQAFTRGGGVEDAVEALSNSVGEMLEGASTNVDIGAINAGMGSLSMMGDTMTKGRADAFAKAISKESINATTLANKTTEDFIKEYEKAQKNAEDKVTATQEATNKIENTAAKSLGLWSTQIPLFWKWAGDILSLLKGIAAWGLGKAAMKLLGGKGLGGGLLKGGSGAGLSEVAKALGTAAGAAWMAYDAFKGFKKSKDWFGENASTSDKAYSVIGGAFGGTGSGIGEKGATAKGVLKNIGSNAAKGALIGSFGGPVGMAIGAGAGAVLGAVGGKRIAKAFKKTANDIKGAVTTWKDPNKSLLTKLKDTAKGVNATITAVTGGISGILFRTLRDKIFGKMKDGIKILKDGLINIAKSSGNSIVNIGKQIGSIIGTGIKGLKSIGSKLGSALKNVASSIASSLKKAGQAALDKIKNSSITSKAKSGLSKLGSKIKGFFASGSDEIPYDGFLAKLHKGETVFNKTATKNIKKLFGITGKSVGESPILRHLESLKDISKKKKKKSFEIIDLLGSFASGTDNSGEGSAILHNGEMIASKTVAEVVNKVSGITGRSVDSESSLLSKLKKSNLDSQKSEEKFDDTRVVNAIVNSTNKIVTAINSDSKSNTKSMSNLKQILKGRVPYDGSIINMEPLADN